MSVDSKERSDSDVCIIGTSNSVFNDGYSSSLKAMFGLESIKNSSIGFSSSHILTFRKGDRDFSDLKYCIIDCYCNDNSLFLSKFTSHDIIKSSLTDAFSIISEKECVPVVLILPIGYGFPSGGSVRSLYRDLANAHGLPFFDMYDLLGDKTDPADQGKIFRDPMHINTPIAQSLGRALGSSLKALPPAFAEGSVFEFDHNYTQSFVRCRDIVKNDDRITSRQTSIAKEDIFDFKDNESIVCRFDPDVEIVALVVDLSNSSGYIKISGANSFTLCLKTEYYRGTREALMVSILPIVNPVCPNHDGDISFSVSSNGPANLSFVQDADFVAVPADAALIGVITRRKSGRASVKLPFNGGVNLIDLVPSAELADLISTFG